jgi:hypothetical protein
MSSKRYPHDGEPADKQPAVREAKARPYSYGKDRRSAQVALSLATVKRRLKKAVKRSKREIAWALEIAGIGEGPADLSEKTREYLYSDK